MIYLALAGLCLMAFAFGYEVGFNAAKKAALEALSTAMEIAASSEQGEGAGR